MGEEERGHNTYVNKKPALVSCQSGLSRVRIDPSTTHTREKTGLIVRATHAERESREREKTHFLSLSFLHGFTRFPQDLSVSLCVVGVVGGMCYRSTPTQRGTHWHILEERRKEDWNWEQLPVNNSCPAPPFWPVPASTSFLTLWHLGLIQMLKLFFFSFFSFISQETIAALRAMRPQRPERHKVPMPPPLRLLPSKDTTERLSSASPVSRTRETHLPLPMTSPL